MFFTKYTLFAEKMFLYGRKLFFFAEICFLQNIHYLQKKWLYMEKNINENVKLYMSHLRNIFSCRKCLCYT